VGEGHFLLRNPKELESDSRVAPIAAKKSFDNYIYFFE
jgi:hypothetical protein